MNRILRVTRLHINRRFEFFVTPLTIVGVVLVLSAIISLALQRGGLDPADPSFAEGARANSGIVWSLPGFLIYYGIQAVSTTYPFGLALGATRRNYILGTALSHVLQALIITVTLLLVLGLELITNHWFASIYVLDVYALGAGDPLALAPRVFLGTLLCLTVGGVFGAVWVRFGARGPAILGLTVGVILALTILLIAPQFFEILANITETQVLVGVLVLVALNLVGTWFAMRRASVR